MVYNLQFSLQLLLCRITLPLILQYLPSDNFQCYTLLSVHSTFCLDFLRWFSIPFGVLASICIWRCQRYNWPLSEIFLNTGSFFSSIPAVAGVSSVSTYYSLIQRWNPVLPLSPERHLHSSFNFQCSVIKSCTFCRYTFLYLFDLMLLYSPLLSMSIPLRTF